MTWAVKVDYEKKAKALEAKGAELEARIAQLETENSELKSEAAATSYKIKIYVDTSALFGGGSGLPIWGGSIGSSPFAPIYNSPFFPSKAGWNANDLVKKPDS